MSAKQRVEFKVLGTPRPKVVQAIARHTAGVRNKIEVAYAEHLDVLVMAGEVTAYVFEGVRLVIGLKRCTYMPDFMVILPAGYIEFHEVKARWSTGNPGWREDARVKIKAAAKQFPWFAFKAVTRQAKKLGGGWDIEAF